MAAVRDMVIRTDGGSIVLEVLVDPLKDVSESLQVTLALHDEVAVAFFASFSCRLKGSVWEGRLDYQSTGKPILLEVASLVDATGKPIEMDRSFLFLEPSSGGAWITGKLAAIERKRLETIREARFDVEIVHPSAKRDDPLFEVIMLVDNLYLTQNLRVPGIQIFPLEQSSIGTDVGIVLNKVIKFFRFLGEINPDDWLHLIRSNRPAAVIRAPKVRASDPENACRIARMHVHRLLDLLALLRRDAPRLLGGAVGSLDGQGMPIFVGSWIEGKGYSGNLLGGFLSGEDQHGLFTLWEGLSRNPRTQLWLSLYADALADERWEYVIFRCYNLLECIYTEAIGRSVIVLDENGKPRFLQKVNPGTSPSYKNCYNTRKHGAAKVYELLRIVAERQQIAISKQKLWDNAILWTSIRNAVAHDASWQIGRNKDIEKEIMARASDGTFEGGVWQVVREIREYLECVLYAALKGHL